MLLGNTNTARGARSASADRYYISNQLCRNIVLVVESPAANAKNATAVHAELNAKLPNCVVGPTNTAKANGIEIFANTVAANAAAKLAPASAAAVPFAPYGEIIVTIADMNAKNSAATISGKAAHTIE